MYNAEQKCIKRSCLSKPHRGLPCEHIYASLQEVHPSMIHPRWYKIWNFRIYESNKSLHQCLNSLVKAHEKTNAVPLSGCEYQLSAF
jgi:hypothetical protein